jgi:hypothetical protein
MINSLASEQSERVEENENDKTKQEQGKEVPQHNIENCFHMAAHLAIAIQTLTGCKVVFEPLQARAGHYLFEPWAESPFIIISTKPLVEGNFSEIWQTMLGLASFHNAIPPQDWRRLLPIEASYRDGHLVNSYQEHLNLESNFVFLSGILMQQSGICSKGFCPNHPEIHLDSHRFWSTRYTRTQEGLSLKPTITGDFYHLVS